MRNVDLRIDSSVVLHVHSLRGELLRVKQEVPPTFDDKQSFVVKAESAVIGITAGDLADLLNRYVFSYPEAPLKSLKVSINGKRLKERGTLRKGIAVPFELEGDVDATPSGLFRLHATSIKSAHLPVKTLMDLLGLKAQNLIHLNGSRGVTVEGNDILLDPERLIPAPRFQGKLSSVRLDGDQITEVFEETDHPPSERTRPLHPSVLARNYMYFRGGTLRFGKLTMKDADLELVDAYPDDPFEFYLDQYNRQLVAGYSKNTSSYGLVVHLPDFSKIGRETAPPPLAGAPAGQPPGRVHSPALSRH